MSISEVQVESLIRRAVETRDNAYAPYSHFRVGAALLTRSGKIFVGCNVENAAYGDAVCAERVAIFSAIAAGERQFVAMAIVGGRDELDAVCPPCGTCRQVLAEFCSPDFAIVMGRPGRFEVVTLGELLPRAFDLGE